MAILYYLLAVSGCLSASLFSEINVDESGIHFNCASTSRRRLSSVPIYQNISISSLVNFWEKAANVSINESCTFYLYFLKNSLQALLLAF